MKYYKLINQRGWNIEDGMVKNKIYPDNWKIENNTKYPDDNISSYVKLYQTDFQEVTEEEYLEQEGKINKLVSGEYYVVIESGNIFRYDNNDQALYYLGDYNTRFARNGGGFDSDITAYRKANNEEIQWLEECNRQNKFIEFYEFKKQMEKKIIGYKLIKPEYEKAAIEIIQVKAIDNSFEKWQEILYLRGYNFTANSRHKYWLEEAGVLDLWFEPVYEEHPDITINGYKAEFFDDYVKFGCAEFDKHEFIFAQEFIQKVLDSKNYGSSKTNREVESITIGKGTFRKEQIKQIAEYYENN